MADDATKETSPTRHGGGKLLVLLAILAAIGAGSTGFAMAWLGWIPSAEQTATSTEPGVKGAPDVAFVPVDVVTIPLGKAGDHQILRLGSQLEVPPDRASEVAHLMPRILDVINTYLRAVDVAELGDPSALLRIRVHLLRRIRIVTGDDSVRDLLITEFLLN